MLATVPRPKKPAAADGPTQINLKLPDELLAAIDGWVADINQRRPWPRMTRSDLIRIVMGRAVQERPDWLGLPPAPDEPEPRR